MTQRTAKAAELASGLGAIGLGVGIGLLAPEAMRALALPTLVGGVLVHGVGMSLKHRLEAAQRPLFWWEKALFWLCWVCLGALLAWMIARLLTL